ncbi:MAG: uroporphyrinogen-III C-methyltransferase [Porticoccaceae bacterium]|nr:uroporphyrinogen-III C-methyltransferase [Porticoccaceae bacterium]
MTETTKQPKAGDQPKSKIKANDKSVKTPKTGAVAPITKPRDFPVLKWACVIVLLSILAGSGWLGWSEWQQQQLQQQSYARLDIDFNDHLQQSQQHYTDSDSLLDVQSNYIKTLSKQLRDLQLQVNGQGARLTELGSTTRSDWYLAEAAYLTRLANQRLQTERSTKNSLALLAQVDDLLSNLEQSDLFSVRAAVAEDIMALRLAGVIDVEGVILEINALANQINRLDLLNLAISTETSDIEEGLLVVDSEEISTDKNVPWMSRFNGFIDGFGGLVKVTDRDIPIQSILSSSEESIVRSNLRLLLQQAANAALREEPAVYAISLENAQQWMATYFQLNAGSKELQERISRLSAVNIVQQLPSVDRSMNALEALIITRQARLLDGAYEQPVINDGNSQP